jgi:hypothetical protein
MNLRRPRLVDSAHPFFSTTSELPLHCTRFVGYLFSVLYKLLFQQVPSFQHHLRCPLFFFLTGQSSRPASRAKSDKSFIYRIYANPPCNPFIYRIYAKRRGRGPSPQFF